MIDTNFDFIFKITEKLFSYSDMAQARPNPSYVEVPRPSSSISTRLFEVAFYKTSSK